MKYDYECPECKAPKAVHRPMAADEEDYFCDECGTQVKRIYGVPGFKPAPGMYSHRGG